jgi:hypothetical protein
MRRNPQQLGRGRLVAAAIGILAVAAAGAACKQKRLKVAAQGVDSTGDYGRIELEAAVAKLRRAPAEAASYRAFAVVVDSLRAQFNEGVTAQAERQLAFLALEPMAAQLEQPLPDQMAALALTVWPTALGVEPAEGETVQSYLERICSGPLAGDCKYVVPEHWPPVLSNLVWDRMKVRARETYSECRMCAQDPTYQDLLKRYDRYQARVSAERAKIGDRVERAAWPEAGDHGAPWSGVPLLDLVADPRRFAGDEIAGDWGDRIASRPDRAKVLGLHLRPRTEVRHVRSVVLAAARAGYQAIALQAREPSFPYQLREYRLATGASRGPSVDLRDVDSVQMLVRAVDAAAARAGSSSGSPPAIRLSAR